VVRLEGRTWVKSSAAQRSPAGFIQHAVDPWRIIDRQWPNQWGWFNRAGNHGLGRSGAGEKNNPQKGVKTR